ncbi:MAG: cold shock domain-containing protein [Bacilli bacterium]|nr:cold shock domain-containing protein [Bacilli bacterium]
MKGRVIWLNPLNGCAFIEYNNENLFIHIQKDDIEKYHLKENQVIEFELDHNTKGVFIKCLKTT